MRLIVNCHNCNKETGFRTSFESRMDFIKNNGDKIKISCKSCESESKYDVNELLIHRNKWSNLLLFVTFLVLTIVALILLWEFIWKLKLLLGLPSFLGIILIPSWIFMIIEKGRHEKINRWR